MSICTYVCTYGPRRIFIWAPKIVNGFYVCKVLVLPIRVQVSSFHFQIRHHTYLCMYISMYTYINKNFGYICTLVHLPLPMTLGAGNSSEILLCQYKLTYVHKYIYNIYMDVCILGFRARNYSRLKILPDTC